MGFKIVKQARAWWPVKWQGLTEDGEPVQNQIELRFRLLKVDEAYEVARAVDEARLVEPTPAGGQMLPAVYTDLVMRFADDWRGVQAENGEPLTWSTENVRLLMNEPGLFGHVFEAFRECLGGGEKVREGN